MHNLMSKSEPVRKIQITQFLSLIFTMFSSMPMFAEPDSSSGKISFLSGEVAIDRPTIPGQSINANIGMTVSEGDTVKTGPGARCEITFQGKYVIRCDEKTKLLIELAKFAVSKWCLPYGNLWMIVKPLLQSEGISVSSPTSTAEIRGTVFSIEADSKAVKYSVYKGAIAVTPADTTGLKRDTGLTVEKGHELTLIRDFDKYRRQNEKTFEQYKTNQNTDFEKFAMSKSGEWTRS